MFLEVIMFGGGIVEKPPRAMVLLCRIQIRWLSHFFCTFYWLSVLYAQ